MPHPDAPASRLNAEAIILPRSMTAPTIPKNATIGTTIHPAWIRTAHGLNALAVILMVTSGWRIYNAAPLFECRFHGEFTLGGWLRGALQWQVAGMWVPLCSTVSSNWH